MNPPDDLLPSAYKSNSIILDAAASPVCHICKYLDASIKSIRCALLDYSSVFDSVPRSLLLHKLGTFGCPKPLLVWVSDCFTNPTQCIRVSGNISKHSVKDSGVFQDANVFSTHISDISTSSSYHSLKYAHDTAFFQASSSNHEFQSFSFIHEFSVQAKLN